MLGLPNTNIINLLGYLVKIYFLREKTFIHVCSVSVNLAIFFDQRASPLDNDMVRPILRTNFSTSWRSWAKFFSSAKG
jgi:hypothetical protein